mgnify:CR=1 FL=1
MWLVPILLRTGIGLGFVYALSILWMAAGLIGVIGLALMIHGGVLLTRRGDGPRAEWSLLRLFRKR